MSEHHHAGPWAVWLNTEDTTDGRPYKLSVTLANESRLNEGDAEWLRGLIADSIERDSTIDDARLMDRAKWQEVELIHLRDRLKIAEMALRGFGLTLEDGR